MTRLSDPELAELARRNDLGGDDVERAIACAIAASDGDPAYHHVVWPGPVADYRGLYGLDVVDWPEYEGADLAHPAVAATVAAELVRETGGWSWCPAYRSGRASHYLERAAPAASVIPGPHRYDDLIRYGHARRQTVRLQDALGAHLGGMARRSQQRTQR